MNRLVIEGVVSTVLLLGLYFYIAWLKSDIASLELANQIIKTELVNKKLSNGRLKNSVSEQNKSIRELELNEKSANAKLAKWKKLPAEVRYKVIYKLQKGKSDECKDIKKYLDNVRNIDFSSL